MDEASAIELTLKQVDGFYQLVNDDEGWKQILEAFKNGRDSDAWLAADWPTGFDELLLCVPLCSYVDFECAKCHVGMRQDNNSCAHDYSLFGYIAEILKTEDRQKLLDHLQTIREIISREDLQWNVLQLKIKN